MLDAQLSLLSGESPIPPVETSMPPAYFTMLSRLELRVGGAGRHCYGASAAFSAGAPEVHAAKPQ